ncbi:dihydrofolate reductase-like [Nilaparvata lugens]|uniref:dihydrofolate reductase-like n=1 Tax=Nilaparvata lugens TaxID=108931 RepID=UPI00193E6753|nr:dihydrofolate reductase-like [Nilaparvata lugens]
MTTKIKLNVIAAADENMGIGKNGVLPWHIPSEFEYFLNMTSKPRPGPQGEGRRNAIIVGRKTWDTMGQVTTRPFPNALNIVLSRESKDNISGTNHESVMVCQSLPEAVEELEKIDDIDEVWVLGGTQIYALSLASPSFHRLFLTKVTGHFECDSHFPPLPSNLVAITAAKVQDQRVPMGVQVDEKSGHSFQVVVYERQ